MCSTLGNHYRDHKGIFFPPSVKLALLKVLDCPVDILEDSRPPELTRDETFHFLLTLVVSITVATIYGSPLVCSRHDKAFHFFDLVLSLDNFPPFDSDGEVDQPVYEGPDS